jgi:asparagine synthase (glutamine-hydrolysing)
MSALAGRWNFDGNPDAAASCKRMLAAQEIYGPHGASQWSDGPFAVGRRLFRTLPEDLFDCQPLHSRDGRLTFVADARLNNRSELASQLKFSRAVMDELSDAAVLFATLQLWGQKALERVAGEFAFALWNSQRLVLARDPLGQRPLHYHCGKHFFAFASMPKGLHGLPEIPYALDEQAVAEFLVVMPVGSRSFFKGISSVKAGHVTTITREGIHSRRYWDPSPPSSRRKAADYVEGLRFHLDQATQSALRGAGAVVGTHLSGGLDSSAVTATAARLLQPVGGKAVAFTSVPREGYDGPAARGRIIDEGPLAAATAALYPNVEHVLVRGHGLSPMDHLDRDFFLFETPMMNLSNWSWGRAINKAARDRNLTVMLNGQMGNMTISYSGTEYLPELLQARRIVDLCRAAAKLVQKGSMRWTGVLGTTIGPFLPPRLWQLLGRANGHDWNVLQYTAIRKERLNELQLPSMATQRGLDFSYRPRANGFESRLWVLRRADFGNYNKGVLAGWGIDQRDPTADRRLIDYCLSVPMDEFQANGETRALARRALADRVPQAVLTERRRGYQGADWHETLTADRESIAAELEALARCEPAARLLDVARLQRLVENWPSAGWENQNVIDSYRLALLRGISAGHFVRKVARTN